MKHFGKILGAAGLASAARRWPPRNIWAVTQMAVPPDYRDWVFLTSSLDLNYSASGDPAPARCTCWTMSSSILTAYKVFLQTGSWPDQTVLVKENRVAESAGTLSKSGRFQTGVMNLEIHVKDQALDRFPGGWAFFVSSDGKAAGRLMPAKRQLLFLPPGSRRGGYDLCAVLSDAAWRRQGQEHAERGLSQGQRREIIRRLDGLVRLGLS